MTDALPRSTKLVVYRLGQRQRAHRTAARLNHIVKETGVRIGSNGHGEPIFSNYFNHKALCGVLVDPVDDRDLEHVGCPKCKTAFRKLQEKEA